MTACCNGASRIRAAPRESATGYALKGVGGMPRKAWRELYGERRVRCSRVFADTLQVPADAASIVPAYSRAPVGVELEDLDILINPATAAVFCARRETQHVDGLDFSPLERFHPL